VDQVVVAATVPIHDRIIIIIIIIWNNSNTSNLNPSLGFKDCPPK
jgi:hypothetical protein